MFDAYREAYASVYKAQQEAFKAVERFAASSTPLLATTWSLAWRRHAPPRCPDARGVAFKQAEFGGQLGEKLRARAEEFTSLASETQGTFAKVLTEFTTKAAASTRKAA